jgi:hypothetical protein
MTKDELSKKQRHALQYWYVDGTFEFTFGGLCMVLGIYFYTQAAMPDTLLSNVLDMFFVLVVIGGAFLFNRLSMMLKERITFPRTGYVAYKSKPEPGRAVSLLIRGVVCALVAVVMVFLLTNRSNGSGGLQGMDWMPAISATIFSVAWLFVGWRTALPRFYVIAVLSLLGGIVITIIRLSNNHGLAAYYGLMAAILFASGAIKLWGYLHENPAPKEEA